MIEIYKNPLDYETMQFSCAFSPALSTAPVSAVVWIERYGVTTEQPATLEPGATTSAATVTYVPSGQFTEPGKYTITVRFKNVSGAHIARTVPQQITSLNYPSGPI